MNLFQDFLACSPFVSPTSKRFVKNATRSGVLGDIPGVGIAVKAVPFASFFDNRLKYPFLITGRLIFSIAIAVALSQLTLSGPWKGVVNDRVLPMVAPAPIKAGLVETGNFLNDNSDRIKIETSYLIDKTVNEIIRSGWKEALSGTIALPIRFAVIYAFISVLYMLLGNTIPQREHQYLKKTGNLADLSKDLLLMLDALASKLNITEQDKMNLKNIIEATQKGDGVSKIQENFVKNLSREIFKQIQNTPSLNIAANTNLQR